MPPSPPPPHKRLPTDWPSSPVGQHPTLCFWPCTSTSRCIRPWVTLSCGSPLAPMCKASGSDWQADPLGSAASPQTLLDF